MRNKDLIFKRVEVEVVCDFTNPPKKPLSPLLLNRLLFSLEKEPSLAQDCVRHETDCGEEGLGMFFVEGLMIVTSGQRPSLPIRELVPRVCGKFLGST
jgi:hypothetical protein